MKLSDYDWSREPTMQDASHEVVFFPVSLAPMHATSEPRDVAQFIDTAFVRADKLREAYTLLKQWTDEFTHQPDSCAPFYESFAELRNAGFVKSDDEGGA